MSQLLAVGVLLAALSMDIVAQNIGIPIAKAFASGQLPVVPSTLFIPKNGQATDECQRELQTFKVIASRFALPRKWRFYVVCDEASWDSYVHHIRVEKHLAPSTPVYGVTYLDAGYTIMRGPKLLRPDALTTPEHIVAHELAHIYLQSIDEISVEALAMLWLAGNNAAPIQ
ncbi:hypothetical protein HDF16_005704 [Granulicella aggregans]|uniref:Uncharacterized protein n=1 Tax=Granulicella aggregans TaxID=474949 RepID=A0A7W7ZJD7_9BACT|nr:hypothetical protein [Granulicella aggregans]MBB5060968.1 hypothetical protein [Granulicella aggregans]